MEFLAEGLKWGAMAGGIVVGFVAVLMIGGVLVVGVARFLWELIP